MSRALETESETPGTPILDALLESVSDGVYCTDAHGRITLWNAAAEAISGYAAGEVVGRRCCDSILVHVDAHGDRLCLTTGCPMQTVLSGRPSPATEAYLLHKAGHRVPVRIRTRPLRREDGGVGGIVEVFTDLSPRESARERIEELQTLALLDPLTQVGNRRYGEIQLETRLSELKRFGWTFGVLFADIDHFKTVNDRYGHDAGDKVLRMVARTFTNTLRSNDAVCRWGGEEFLALVINVSEGQLAGVAEKVRALVQQSSYLHLGEHLKVTVSIGAAMADAGDSVETLVRRADRLLYQCKTGGRNRVTASPSESPAGQ
jgi:diguanylate cyclase (GGDEF)-like protein/PAS domain S-box-containing protein